MVTAQKIHGADISHWQGGSLNLATAKKAGLRFLFHKATEGAGYTDPNYAKRRAEAKAAGVPFGAYHFAKAAGSPEAQAAHFLKVASPHKGDIRPALDFEDPALGRWSTAAKSDFVRRFVAAVEKATGVKPFIYIPGTWSLNSTFDCPLWVPRYSNSNAAPRIPRPWKTWTIWQFSNGVYGEPKSVAGIGHCDLNTLNMDPARFLEVFTIGGVAKPAAKKAPAKPAPVKEQPVKKRQHSQPDPERDVELITANLDFATAPDKDRQHIDHLARLHPHVKKKVLFAQEAKNLRGSNALARLGARLRPLLTATQVKQDTSSPARAGTGFMAWGIKVRGFHLWSLGKSAATLERWVAHAAIDVPGGKLVIFSPHDFPKRAGKAAQDRYLQRLKKQTDHVHKEGNAWAVGTDANMPLSEVAKYLNGQQYGDGHNGIVGFVTSLNVDVSRHGVDTYGVRHHLTDHPAVWIDVAGVKR